MGENMKACRGLQVSGPKAAYGYLVRQPVR